MRTTKNEVEASAALDQITIGLAGKTQEALEIAGRLGSRLAALSMMALLDSLGSGTLNEHQRQTLQALRAGISSLALAGKTLSIPHQ